LNFKPLQSDDYLDTEIESTDTWRARAGELAGMSLLKAKFSVLSQTTSADKLTTSLADTESVPPGIVPQQDRVSRPSRTRDNTAKTKATGAGEASVQPRVARPINNDLNQSFNINDGTRNKRVCRMMR
jgi:hypothetical protein